MLSSPPLRLAFVGTALRKQVTIVEKTADETFGRHPLVAPFCVTHLQVPGPVPSDAPVQTIEERVMQHVFRIIVVGRRRFVFLAVPGAAPGGIKVPGREPQHFAAFRTPLVVVEVIHILAVVVLCQDNFREEIIVAKDGVVKKRIHLLIKSFIVGRCHEVDRVPERPPVNSFLFPVGIFNFISSPSFLFQVVIVGRGRFLWISVGIEIMPHKHLIRPVDSLVERAVDGVEREVRAILIPLCRHKFLQLQLLAVNFLRHAVEPVVASVADDLHKPSPRSRLSLLLPSLSAVVRLRGDVVPEVGRHAVAHTHIVVIHGVENPVVVIPQSEKLMIERIALRII